MIRQICTVALFLFSLLFANANSGDAWKDILKNKSGTVKFYWYPNNVIIENSLDIIDGIEHDLAVSFIEYLEAMYDVDIEMEWIQTDSFDQVMSTIRSGSGGTFGASSISITEERKMFLNFTQPYLADVAVLVSSSNIPIALSELQLKEVFSNKRAISIQNTTLISSLEKLKNELNIDFQIEYVDNSGDIIDRISEGSDQFGYVDIANFLVALDNNTDVRRQFFYPVKLEGLAMVFPKNTDWSEPVNDYFTSPRFIEDRQQIITKYLGSNASDIIERISTSAEMGPLEEIVISNREKEAQYERLLEAAERDKEAERLSIILISIILAVIVVLVLVYALYRIKSQNAAQLLKQQRIIEQTNNQLRTINEDKNNLIQVLAHDLRSPLANIYNGSQLIQAREELSEEGKKISGFILESSEKMQSLIAKILDVEAIETGKHNVKQERIEVSEIIRKVVNQNKPSAKQKQIQIHIDIEGELFVLADEVYTSQVIENLTTNAIKYSPAKSGIEINAREDGDMIRISVKDSGPGLTEEDEKKLFRKYQQLSAKPTKGEDSIGLGLSIVKLFTERMGGEVKYETELGHGTTFHILLKKA